MMEARDEVRPEAYKKKGLPNSWQHAAGTTGFDLSIEWGRRKGLSEVQSDVQAYFPDKSTLHNDKQ
jgi:hypothetical protein